MPRYDFTCAICGDTRDESVFLADRDKPMFYCHDVAMKREFPLNAVKGFFSFESYHDPALGVDINGPGEKAEILRAMGVHEAGDPVGGARNFETSKEAVILDREPPTGRRLSDHQRDVEQGMKEKANFMVQTEGKDGKVSDPVRAQDMQSPSSAVKSGFSPTRTTMKVQP